VATYLLQGNHTFAENEPFVLEAGGSLSPLNVRYALYGRLNRDASNAVLVCHALTGSARVQDWWPELFAPTGPLDPSRHCIIGVNVIGGCYGSTGPGSINAATGEPYGAEFPLVSVRDMVRAQAEILNLFGIQRLHAVVGSSLGAMQALQWAVDFPERVANCIAIGAAPLNAMGLALNHAQRVAIQLDPKWLGGRYAKDDPPAVGLGLARQIAMCTYKSAELFDQRHGRRPNRKGEDPYAATAARFDIAGYLDHQGEKLVTRFDANTYIVLSKAMDLWDPARQYGSAQAAYARVQAKVRLVGISSDWLFPAADVRKLAEEISGAGARCRYVEMVSDHGHDAFLAEPQQLSPLISDVFGDTPGSFRGNPSVAGLRAAANGD
jgi:homoserine O-acetyltransferase/O-succinyltransferase